MVKTQTLGSAGSPVPCPHCPVCRDVSVFKAVWMWGLDQKQRRQRPCSLPALPAAARSIAHRRLWGCSWKALPSPTLPCKHIPKTMTKSRENLIHNYPLLSPRNNRRKMFRIRLIVAVFSASYFLHNLPFIFSLLSSRINATAACSCHRAVSFKGALKTYF